MNEDDRTIATPEQICEAWCAVSRLAGSSRARQTAAEEIRAHPVPPDVKDPIFHRDSHPSDGGWHRARDISNIGAQNDMRDYLLRQDLILPPEVFMAWAQTREKQQWRSDINGVVANAIAKATPDAEGIRDILTAVIKDLRAMQKHLGQEVLSVE